MKPDDTGQAGNDSWWAALARPLLHRVQVEIIEALWRSDRPLTPRDFSEIVEGARVATINHHLRRLRTINAVAYAEEPTRLNLFDISYRLVLRPNDRD